MFMGYIILGGLVGLVIGWVVAEFKGRRSVRVALGLAAIVFTTFFASVGGTVNAYYTALYHRESLPMLRDLLAEARFDEAKRIVGEYCERRGKTGQLNNAFQLRQALTAETRATRLDGGD
jgi:hypothetical protein